MCEESEQLIIDMHYVTSFITNETALTLLRHTGTHSHTGIMFIITQQNVDIVCFADKKQKKTRSYSDKFNFNFGTDQHILP